VKKWEIQALQAECAVDSIQIMKGEFSVAMMKELQSLKAEIKESTFGIAYTSNRSRILKLRATPS